MCTSPSAVVDRQAFAVLPDAVIIVCSIVGTWRLNLSLALCVSRAMEAQVDPYIM